MEVCKEELPKTKRITPPPQDSRSITNLVRRMPHPTMMSTISWIAAKEKEKISQMDQRNPLTFK